jgi:hypothetical protein
VGQLADDAFQIALKHDAEQIATTTADVLDVLQRRVSRHESPEAALAFEERQLAQIAIEPEQIKRVEDRLCATETSGRRTAAARQARRIRVRRRGWPSAL